MVVDQNVILQGRIAQYDRDYYGLWGGLQSV